MENLSYLTPDPLEEPARILLVEDSPSVLRAMERQLSLAGYEFLSAIHGKAALELLEKTPKICLIISDWCMPEMNGIELLEAVRKDPKLQTIPFLMVTGIDNTEDVVFALRQGANDYIQKPYQPEELLARCRNLIRMWEFEQKLQEQATFDELTTLYNKANFTKILESEIARVKRYGATLSLILFDIDFFKWVNDNYGHPVGDQVLAALGRYTRKQVRSVDFPCRFGGEEFAVILPCTDLFGATVLAERLCRGCAELAIQGKEGETFTITCSFGVAELMVGEDDSASFIEKADMALYDSKKNGRNRVSTATR